MAEDEIRVLRRKVLIVAAALPILYVLSTGPVIGVAMLLIGEMRHPWQASLAARFEIASRQLYAPLESLADHLPWFERFLEWYVGLFV